MQQRQSRGRLDQEGVGGWWPVVSVVACRLGAGGGEVAACTRSGEGSRSRVEGLDG